MHILLLFRRVVMAFRPMTRYSQGRTYGRERAMPGHSRMLWNESSGIYWSSPPQVGTHFRRSNTRRLFSSCPRNSRSRYFGGQIYNFEPYNYGPFDSAVYADAVRLTASDLATVTESSGWVDAKYAATPEGITKAKKLHDQLPFEVVKFVADVVSWDGEVSPSRLSFVQSIPLIPR